MASDNVVHEFLVGDEVSVDTQSLAGKLTAIDGATGLVLGVSGDKNFVYVIIKFPRPKSYQLFRLGTQSVKYSGVNMLPDHMRYTNIVDDCNVEGVPFVVEVDFADSKSLGSQFFLSYVHCIVGDSVVVTDGKKLAIARVKKIHSWPQHPVFREHVVLQRVDFVDHSVRRSMSLKHIRQQMDSIVDEWVSEGKAYDTIAAQSGDSRMVNLLQEYKAVVADGGDEQSL